VIALGTTSKAIEMIDEVKKIMKIIDGNKDINKDIEESVLARIRSFPSMLQSSGLAPSLAYLLSKSDNNSYEKLWRGEKPSGKKKEELGYTIYLYVVVKFIKNEFGYEVEKWEDLIKFLREMDESKENSGVIHQFLLEFLTEFKKIGEATLEG